MLWSVESLNRHSNISILVSAFTFAFVRERETNEGRKEGWLTDRQDERKAERRALTR